MPELPAEFRPEYTVLASRVMRSVQMRPSLVFYVTPAAALPEPPPGGERFAIMGWSDTEGHYVIGSRESLAVAKLYLEWAAHFRARVTRLDFDMWRRLREEGA